MKPKRVQRKRTKGWRMPEGAVYVGRPTKWGNAFMVGGESPYGGRIWDRADAVNHYRSHWQGYILDTEAALELRGKDLACWCPLDEPCHADVLLEWANS